MPNKAKDCKSDDPNECKRERPKKYEVRIVKVMLTCLEKLKPSHELKECKKVYKNAWTANKN